MSVVRWVVGGIIRCLDLSTSQKMVAVVDDANELHVYDLASRKVLWTAEGATSAAWNTQFDDMLCYSGKGYLCTKTADFAVQRQKFQGFVVGFSGSKAYCLHNLAMQTLDVPLSATMQSFVNLGAFETAYQVACLGVTDADWRDFAEAAVHALVLDLAAAAYTRIGDAHVLSGVQSLSQQISEGLAVHLAHAAACALLGNSEYTAQEQKEERDQNRRNDRPVETNVTRKDIAVIQSMGTGDVQQICQTESFELHHRSQGLSSTQNEIEAAAMAAMEAGDLVTAVELLAQHGLWARLLQVAANLDIERANERTALCCAAAAFRHGGQSDTARELFNKLGDYKALAQMAIQEGRWEEVLMLQKRCSDLCQIVAVPRACHLLANGCHEEAYATYMEAGMVEEAITVMQQLVRTAVTDGRFRDAARHTLQIGLDALAQLEGAPRSSQEVTKGVESFQRHYTQAQIYQGYQLVHQAMIGEPSSVVPSTLFHTAHFVLTRLLQLGTAHLPTGVSLVGVLQCLATHSGTFGAHHIAAAACSSLQQYYLPESQQEKQEVAALLSRSRQSVPAEDFLPVCFRCGMPGQLQFMQEQQCQSCGCGYVRSMFSFECLPLIEVFLEEGLSDTEAAHILQQASNQASLSLRDNYGSSQFGRTRGDIQVKDHEDEVLESVIIGRAGLESTGTRNILVQRWPAACLPARYFIVMDPDMALSMSPMGPVEDELDFYMARNG